MKSQIEIANCALSFLGIDGITSLVEDSKEAKTVEMFFQTSKEIILREFVFDWAHKVTKLVKYSDDEGGYTLPSDYINYIGLGVDSCFDINNINQINIDNEISVRLLNGRLQIQSFICLNEFKYMHYTFDNTNYSSAPKDLLLCFAIKLASLCCFALTGKQGLQAQLEQLYALEFKKCKSVAGMEHKPLRNVTSLCYPF